MPDPIKDGGPAFPDPVAITPAGDAYPSNSSGMSLRDWFAGQALAGICSDGDAIRRISSSIELTGPQIAAEAAYAAADAMLAAREAR